jgi:hypothetical protein
MEGGHDDFERGFGLEFWVLVDRNAAPIVAHGQGSVRGEMNFDAGGMPRHGFVHGVVEHFGEQVMQRSFIRSADIHPRPLAHGFEPLEDLDILGAVGLSGGLLGPGRGGHGVSGEVGEERESGLQSSRSKGKPNEEAWG